MNKYYKLYLLKSLLDFNFFLLNSKKIVSKNNSRYFNYFIQKKFSKKKSVILLDPAEIMKSIKQIIRQLRFLSTQDKSLLNIYFRSTYGFHWMKYLISKNKKHFLYNHTALRRNVFLKKTNNSLSFLFRFGSMKKKINSQKFFFENIFIIQDINLNLEYNDSGVYKLFNDFSDWKKLLFFYILLKKVFKKGDYEKNS